jgi:hemoglobin-like flavoprotein
MNTELIAETWDSLSHRHIDVIEIFYDRFFERFPRYREMFPARMDQQMKKMVRTMAMVARLSEDEPIIAPHMAEVGDRRSPRPGTRPENFSGVPGGYSRGVW